LESFLIEITADVLRHIDEEGGKDFVDVVLDRAEQKGTGRWTVQSALDLGVPTTGIAEATFARSLPGHAEQRGPAREVFGSHTGELSIDDRDAFVEDVRKALYASKVVAYAQGFDQIKAGSEVHGWVVDRGAMAGIWRGGLLSAPASSTGCARPTTPTPNCPRSWWRSTSPMRSRTAWRRVVSAAVQAGVPTPAFSSSLAYYDALRAERLPAALIQGLRDSFGAHTYQRTDRPGSFHVSWAEDGKQRAA
jgi:6-phosphogluconate dehydrogenase